MHSFGIWYKIKEGEKPSDVELHINLWNIRSRRSKDTEPFIDIGIVVNDFKNVEKLLVFFPFYFDEMEIEDLHDKVTDVKNARTIFNDNNVNSHTKSNYVYLGHDEDKFKRLLFKIRSGTDFSNGVTFYDAAYEGITFKVLKLDFGEIVADSSCDEFCDTYFRFRVKTRDLKEKLFCSLHKRNWFLESGFVATQVVDFKINKERNLPFEITHQLSNEGYCLVAFSKIHFLIMADAVDECVSLSKYLAECRKLEENDWNDYLNKEYATDEVLVYHFKQKSDEERDNAPMRDFSALVKIATHKSTVMTIVVYILVLLLTGTIGGMFGSELLSGLKFLIE